MIQAAHEKLTAIGTLLEKLDEVNLIDGEDGGRGESPFTSSVGESETASDHQPNRTPSQPATNEHNVSKQQDEISISPTEDVTLNNELDAEQAAPALPRQQQPHVVQNNHHHIPPQQETSVVTSPAVSFHRCSRRAFSRYPDRASDSNLSVSLLPEGGTRRTPSSTG